MALDPSHRTSARTLRKLAEGHMFFEIGERPPGAWDTFSTRFLGLAVNRKLASNFGGNAIQMRERVSVHLAHALGVSIRRWAPREQKVFSNFAFALSLSRGIDKWSISEKRDLVAIIRAKAVSDETKYLGFLQQHERLRAAFLRVGSASRLET
jgi:hypothetical protein